MDYIYDIRESIAEAYIGIAQGLKQANKGSLLINYAQQLFSFLEVAVQEPERSESYTKVMMGLLGYCGLTSDLADTIPPGHLKAFFGAHWITSFIKEIKTDRFYSPETKNYARWTKQLVQRQL